MSSRSGSRKRNRSTRSKSPKVTKKRKTSKSRSRNDESSEEMTKRARPANQLIKSRVNEEKSSIIASIYGFGNNSLGQLGMDPEKTEKTDTTLIDRLDDINCLDVSCGSAMSIVVEANKVPKYRKLILFGTMDVKRDKESKKEIKDDSDKLSWNTTSFDFFDKMSIVQATAGESHCAVLTEDGDVYTWGIYKDEKGQKVGFKINRPLTEIQEDPEKIDFNINDIIVQIASTPNRTLALSQVGEVYEWGYTKMQNKTSSRNANRSLLPQLVIMQEKAHAIFCCAGEQIFVVVESSKKKGKDKKDDDDDDEEKKDVVYAWGNNVNYQLGIDKWQPPTEEDKTKEKKKEKEEPKEKTKGSKEKDTKKKGGKAGEKPEKEKKEKKFGNVDELKSIGTEGETKRARKKKDYHMRPVPATLVNALQEKILKISGGLTHTVLLTKGGHVYVWGGNKYGQLGLGKKTDEEVAEPTKLSINNVRDISCGAYHTVLVTKDGEVYAFGYAKDGRIPYDAENEIISEPVKICGKLKKHKVVQVHCGKRHTLLVGVKDD